MTSEQQLWPEESHASTTVPCELAITKENPTGQFPFIRIEATDHLWVMARLDMSLDDFARLMVGETVTAAYSTGRAA